MMSMREEVVTRGLIGESRWSGWVGEYRREEMSGEEGRETCH